jgi:hypothetical protein
MPCATPAWSQHEQETLEALDRIIFAAQSYRADVAARMPSAAKAAQLAADMAKVLLGTGHMTGLANAAAVLARQASA